MASFGENTHKSYRSLEEQTHISSMFPATEKAKQWNIFSFDVQYFFVYHNQTNYSCICILQLHKDERCLYEGS